MRPSHPLRLSTSMSVLVERLRRLGAGHAHYSDGVSDAHVREGCMTLCLSGRPKLHKSVAVVIADTSASYEVIARERGGRGGAPLHPHVRPAALRLVAMYLGILRPAVMEVGDLANLSLASLWIAIKLRMEWQPLAREMVRLVAARSSCGAAPLTKQTLLRAEQRLLETVGWRLHPPLAVEAAEHLVEATGLPACASSWATASLALVAGDVELAVVSDPILVGAAAVHLCMDRGAPRPHMRRSLERVLTDAGASLQELPAAIAALRGAIDRAPGSARLR